MATIEQARIVFSLWVSDTLPADKPQWHKLDQSIDRGSLERQAKSLRPLMANRRLAVVDGERAPYWSPKL